MGGGERARTRAGAGAIDAGEEGRAGLEVVGGVDRLAGLGRAQAAVLGQDAEGLDQAREARRRGGPGGPPRASARSGSPGGAAAGAAARRRPQSPRQMPTREAQEGDVTPGECHGGAG